MEGGLTEDDIKKIVAEVVAETLLTLGIATDQPLEVQRDMQHLRAWRESVATVKRQGLMTAVGIVTAGIVGLVWVAVKNPPS